MVRLVIDIDDEALARTLTTPVAFVRRASEAIAALLDAERYRGPMIVRCVNADTYATVAVCAVEQLGNSSGS